MPSYKTHAIQGEIIFSEIDLKTNINVEEFKMFCLGPDALAPINFNLFRLNHTSNTKDFFLTMINYIKKNHLEFDSEVMAFLYGQLEHFVLDLIIHPLIIYMTEGMPQEYVVNAHGLVEHLIDDYVIDKYNIDKKSFSKKMAINKQETYELINNVYEKVYNASNIGLQYGAGYLATKFYDGIVRRDETNIISTLTDFINLGDIKYHNNSELAKPYLNLEHDIWYNPETGVAYTLSFDDLFERANEVLLETINDVNNYLYYDKPLNNSIILNNTSYLTGLPCGFGQNKKYYKIYKIM